MFIRAARPVFCVKGSAAEQASSITGREHAPPAPPRVAERRPGPALSGGKSATLHGVRAYRSWLPRIPAAALLAALLLVACGEAEPERVELQLEDLVRFAEGYDGKRVTTTGVVRSFADPEHYWIEDERLNRVELRPESEAASLVGKTVLITGRFHRSADGVRFIRVESVRVVAQ